MNKIKWLTWELVGYEMKYEVYKITNNVNDKVYVGITSIGFKNRFKQHVRANSYIGREIRRIGVENFKISIIDVAKTREEIMRKEVYWIDFYDSFNDGYNLTTGGEGASLNRTIKVTLNENQKRFIKSVEKENEKSIDINDHEFMVKNILINLMHCYLLSDNERDKKESARVILKLKIIWLKKILDTNLLNLKELKSWAA